VSLSHSKWVESGLFLAAFYLHFYGK